MEDLTAIMLTLNKLPDKWVEYHKKVLLEAIGDYPLITISKKPMDWGLNIIQEEPESVSNLYWQMLKGAKLAKTKYIAMVDDDTLYPAEHFHSFRPPLDQFGYNMNRWALFTWGKPFYFYRNRNSNCLLIAPRELVIKGLEDKFNRYGKELPARASRELVTRHNRKGYLEFYTYEPVVNFYHDFGIDPLEKNHRKKPWPIQAFDIPKWGRVEELRKRFM